MKEGGCHLLFQGDLSAKDLLKDACGREEARKRELKVLFEQMFLTA